MMMWGRYITMGSGGGRRKLCTSSAAMEEKEQPAPSLPLYRRLSALGATGESVSNAMNQYVREGKTASKLQILSCVRQLRKYKRFQHALEVRLCHIRVLLFSTIHYGIHKLRNEPRVAFYITTIYYGKSWKKQSLSRIASCCRVSTTITMTINSTALPALLTVGSWRPKDLGLLPWLCLNGCTITLLADTQLVLTSLIIYHGLHESDFTLHEFRAWVLGNMYF